MWRSCAVLWDTGDTFCYRRGDDGFYDLNFFPNEDMPFDGAAFTTISCSFESIMKEKYPAESAQLIVCEGLSCDPGLVMLLEGLSPLEAALRVASAACQ